MIKNGLLKRKTSSIHHRDENYHQEYLNKILENNKATRRQGFGSLLGTVASTSVSISRLGSLKMQDSGMLIKGSRANLNNNDHDDSFREALAQSVQLQSEPLPELTLLVI